jgi:hypothetical protein
MSNLQELQLRRTRRTFAHWDEFVPASLVAESDAAVQQLIERLIALGASPSREQVRAEIDRCVRRFNELDRSVPNSWIFTIEREDIAGALWKLIDLCGFEGGEEWLDEREW